MGEWERKRGFRFTWDCDSKCGYDHIILVLTYLLYQLRNTNNKLIASTGMIIIITILTSPVKTCE